MKNAFRFLAAFLSLILCVVFFAACGGQTGSNTTTNAPATDPAPDAGTTAGTEPFVAPPDAIGLVVSADAALITWYTYESDKETIDFMGVDVKALGDASSDMSLYYLESDVDYYLIKNSKLVDATVDDVLPGSVVGVTTLEEGVQEVYIISQPAEEVEEPVEDDVVEEVADDIPTDTTAETAADTEQENASSDEENS